METALTPSSLLQTVSVTASAVALVAGCSSRNRICHASKPFSFCMRDQLANLFSPRRL